jgi:hypothetical protein
MIKSRSKALLAVVTAGALTMTWAGPARADSFTVTTSCSNPFTPAQAGPTTFDLTVPATAVAGQPAAVTATFAFTNTTGVDIDDLNTFSEPVTAVNGSDTSTVTLTAGSQGAVPNGSSVTVTETGTWTPTTAGTTTLTAGTFTFNASAFGLTIPITCDFTSTAPAVTSVVSLPPDTTAPAGTFSLNTASPWIGQKTTVTQVGIADNGVSDPASVTRVLSWGDGTTATLTAGEGPVSKTYATTGTYTVTLTLTDAAGNQSGTAAKVTVTDPGHFKLNKTTVWQHESLAAAISGVPSGTTKIVLNWGDGYASTLAGKNQTATHTYHRLSSGKALPASLSLTAVYTNKFGASSALAVGTVSIRKDSWRPTVSVTKPSHPERVSSWSTVRGKAADKGSGVQKVTVTVIRTSGGASYCYTTKHTWLKLTAGTNRTPCALVVGVSSKGTWAVAVKGLKKGTLTVTAVAMDWADQNSTTAKVSQKLTK